MTASDDGEFFDVLIIGAGISGIGAAYRLHQRNPQVTYRILERRTRIGARSSDCGSPGSGGISSYSSWVSTISLA